MNANLTTQKQRFSVAITTDHYRDMISNTLGDPERSRRFVAAITSSVAVNPALQDCNPATILAGALLGESLNLSPSPQLGQYYLVPFENRIKGKDGKTLYVTNEKGEKVLDERGKWIPVTEKQAQFVMGYKGYIQLAIRSGQYKDMDVMIIHEGEYLGKDPSTGKARFRFIEDDDERESRPVIGYLAYFEYLNGFIKSVYWSKVKMINHADEYSAAFNAEIMKKLEAGEIPENEKWKYSSLWYKNFGEMAKKTMLRHLISRWGIMSIDMQQAFVHDSQIIQMNESGFDGSYDDLPEAPPAPEEPSNKVNLADL